MPSALSYTVFCMHSMPSQGSAKQDWRKWARSTRKATPDVSDDIIQHLAQWIYDQDIQHVLTYKAFGSEISLERLPKLLPDVRFYVPKAETEPEPHMTIHPWETATLRHALGMLQPPPGTPEEDPEVLQLVLIPGLAFDHQGYRLGYGMGHYDRFLSGLSRDCKLVGVTSDALLVKKLPHEQHDLPVQWIVTEYGLTETNSGF